VAAVRLIDPLAERVDPQWEQQNADELALAWQKAQHERANARQQERAVQSIGTRIDTAIHRLSAMSVIAAGRIARQSRGSDHDTLPQPVDNPTQVIAQELEIITRQLDLIETKVDVEAGLIEPQPSRLGSTAEKDREIWDDWKGYRAAEVAHFAPHLGSARTIERARARMAAELGVKVRLVDGTIVAADEPRAA
jgi:hypothetical protein